MDLLMSADAWIALLTLTLLELVLGIDNVIFISILADKLPPDQRDKARRIGLGLAMVMRIALLLVISWIVGLKTPIIGDSLSGRDLIMISGGLFLLWKATKEIHQLLEGIEGEASSGVEATFASVIAQIILIDIVFSLDSIITAVGMVDEVLIMIMAVVISVSLMMFFAPAIGKFVSSHPTVKMLALAFLCTIGVTLIADGFGHHVPKGYIYFAMAFSIAVESLNFKLRKQAPRPVDLREAYVRSED